MPEKIYFTTAEKGLDDVSAELTLANDRLTDGKARIELANTSLNGMGGKYAKLRDDIQYTAGLPENADNVAWQNMNARMSAILDDRQTLKNYSNDVKTAIDSIPEPTQPQAAAGRRR